MNEDKDLEAKREAQRKMLEKILIFDDRPREDGRYGNLIPMTLTQLIIVFCIMMLIGFLVVKRGLQVEDKQITLPKTETIE